MEVNWGLARDPSIFFKFFLLLVIIDARQAVGFL